MCVSELCVDTMYTISSVTTYDVDNLRAIEGIVTFFFVFFFYIYNGPHFSGPDCRIVLYITLLDIIGTIGLFILVKYVEHVLHYFFEKKIIQ